MQTKEERFNAIIADNRERINGICRYYTSNCEDQKDIFQEVLVNIWKSLDSFRGDSAISTWIYRIAVNTSLSFKGKSAKNLTITINSDSQILNQVFYEDEAKEKQIQEHHIEMLQSELNTLSVIDKLLISLMLEGLSMKEIADIVGITEPNVKVKIHRIKQELKSKLTGGCHD